MTTIGAPGKCDTDQAVGEEHFVVRKRRKNKKRGPIRLKQDSIPWPGGSQTAPLACALFKQETVVRADVEALFVIVFRKCGLGSKTVQVSD